MGVSLSSVRLVQGLYWLWERLNELKFVDQMPNKENKKMPNKETIGAKGWVDKRGPWRHPTKILRIRKETIERK